MEFLLKNRKECLVLGAIERVLLLFFGKEYNLPFQKLFIHLRSQAWRLSIIIQFGLFGHY